MSMLTQPSFAPKASIILILAGTLMDVWALVWRYTLAGTELTPLQRFWFLGFVFTGLTLFVVGILLGRIGQAARKSELPPESAAAAEASIQQTAAAHPNPVVPGVAPQVANVPGTTMPAANAAVRSGNTGVVLPTATPVATH